MLEHSFTLDEYEVHPKHNKIELNGKVFRVEPKIMEVLCLLSFKQGEVLSREEIASQLWPDKVVSLEIITRAIFELRRIFNDDPKKPRFIETVARKGYCFILPVSDLENDNAGEPLINNEIDLQSRSTPLTYLVLTGFILAIISALWFTSPTFNQVSDSKLNYDSSMLTNEVGFADMPDLNPVKPFVVYTNTGEQSQSVRQLIVKNVNTHEEHVITDTPSDIRSPKWDSNGENIYYVNCAESGCKLLKHSVSSDQSSVLHNFDYEIRSIALKDDEQTMILARREGRDLSLLQFDLNTKQTKELDIPKGWLTLAEFIPKQEKFVFVRHFQDKASQLIVYDLNEEKAYQIPHDFNTLLSVAPIDDTMMWVAGKKEGKTGLWQLNIQNSQMQPVSNAFQGQFFSGITGAYKDNQLIYKLWGRDFRVEQLGLSDEVLPENSKTLDMRAAYSPELQSVYWVSNRSGAYEIWQNQSKTARKLTSLSANSLSRPVLSPDKTLLAFLEKGKTQAQLHVYDLSTNTLIKSIQWPNNAFLLSWNESQNGFYFTLFEKNQYILSFFDLKTKEFEKVALDAGAFVQQQNDDLIYLNIKNKRLMRKYANGATEVLFDFGTLPLVIAPHTIELANNTLYFILQEERSLSMYGYNFTLQQSQKLYELPAGATVTSIGATPQPYVIYDRLLSNRSQLVMLNKIEK